MYSSAKAFTILEILVVMSIIVLFSGLSVGGYVNSNRTKALEEDAELLVSRLELAREYALTRNVGQTTCDLDGYAVTMTANGTQYSLVRRCLVLGSPVSTTIETFNLSSTIFSSITPSPNEAYFRYPLGASATSKTIVIRNTRNAKCISISLLPHSAITANEPYAC